MTGAEGSFRCEEWAIHDSFSTPLAVALFENPSLWYNMPMGQAQGVGL